MLSGISRVPKNGGEQVKKGTVCVVASAVCLVNIQKRLLDARWVRLLVTMHPRCIDQPVDQITMQ